MDLSVACLAKIKRTAGVEEFKKFQEAIDANDAAAFNALIDNENTRLSKARKDAIRDAVIKGDIVDRINAAIKEDVAQAKRKNKTPKLKREDILMDMLSGTRQAAKTTPAERYIEGVKGTFIQQLIDEIHEVRPMVVGTVRKGGGSRALSITKAIFKEAFDDDSIKHIADKWQKVLTGMKDRFNRAGGSITEFEDYLLPSTHYVPKLARTSKDEWMADAKLWFNLRKPGTKRGEPVGEFASEEIDQVLGNIYDGIIGEKPPSIDYHAVGKQGKVKISSGGQQFRYLQPKNADGWMNYNSKYGLHNHPVDAMISMIDDMSTSIGLMEKFGTNPRKMVTDMVEHIRDTGADKQAGQHVLDTFNQISTPMAPIDNIVVNSLRAVRNLQTASKLGSAPITAMTDAAFMTATSIYNGINPVRTLARHFRSLLPMGAEGRKQAASLGLHAQYAMSRAASINRYNLSSGYGATQRLADMSVRMSGLNHWTNTARDSFGLEFLASLGDNAGKSFDQMTGGQRRALERYGLTASDWDSMRGSTMTKGSTVYLDPTKMDDALSAKTIAMVKEEATFAVPEPNAKARAYVDFGQSPNTWGSEVVRTGLQFKHFPIAIMVSHWGRALDASTLPGRVAYGSSLIAGTTVLGSAVLWSKDVLNGKTPRETSPSFVLESMVQGGGMGLLGDLFFTDPTLFGGWPAFVAGPTVGDAGKIATYFWDIGERAVADDFALDWAEEAGMTALLGAEGVTAFANNLWYTKLLYQQSIGRTMHEMVDPEYYQKEKRRYKWMQEERGQEYWWDPTK